MAALDECVDAGCVADNPAIGDDGLTALAEALKSNSNLTAVRVCGACVVCTEL